MLLLIADVLNFAAGSFVAGWLIIVSRLAAIAGLVILTVVLAVIIKYNLHVRRDIRERRQWSD